MSFLFPKTKGPTPPPPPPAPPTEASKEVQSVDLGTGGYSSLISTGPGGLTRKAETRKSSLIGGA